MSRRTVRSADHTRLTSALPIGSSARCPTPPQHASAATRAPWHWPETPHVHRQKPIQAHAHALGRHPSHSGTQIPSQRRAPSDKCQRIGGAHNPCPGLGWGSLGAALSRMMSAADRDISGPAMPPAQTHRQARQQRALGYDTSVACRYLLTLTLTLTLTPPLSRTT
jgi:hypothetical protein